MYCKNVIYIINVILILVMAFLVAKFAGCKKSCRRNNRLKVIIELNPTATNALCT